MTFEWPPIHSFPPFFTRQANDSVWEEQRLLWQSMVLRYAQHNRLWRMSISELLQSDLFFNRSLNRGLKLETAIEIVQNLVRSGNAEWVSGSNSTAIYIYWYRAEEWAELIAQWVEKTEQKNSVLTFFDITNGDLTSQEEFHQMDYHILQKSLAVLAKQKAAVIFRTHDGEEHGVKFF